MDVGRSGGVDVGSGDRVGVLRDIRHNGRRVHLSTEPLQTV